MTDFPLARWLLPLWTLLTASAAVAQLSPEAQAHLTALQQQPELAGELIYTGTVRSLDALDPRVLLHYQRRVSRIGDSFTATHLSQALDGTLLLTETAEYDARYAVQSFESTNGQNGFSGAARVSDNGRTLDYELLKNGRLRTASERIDQPLVTGPSLFGFILQHWSELQAGRVLSFRMLVLKDMTTYGFEVLPGVTTGDRTRFTIRPASWLVRMMVAPLTVEFDAARQPTMYAGRVPPMQEVDGRLRDLDARVDYRLEVPVYR